MSKIKFIIKSVLQVLNGENGVAVMPSDEALDGAIVKAERSLTALEYRVKNEVSYAQKLDGFDEFLSIVKQDNNQEAVKNFLLAQELPEWQGIKKLLLENEAAEVVIINRDILELIREFQPELLAEDLRALSPLSDSNLASYHSSKDSDYEPGLSSKSSGSTNVDENKIPVPRREKAKTVVAPSIRGEVKTYAKEMMGGFEFEIRDHAVYVSDKSEIRRPTAVTGNLGSNAGDHVIPFSLFIRDIEAQIKGKPVFEAIERLAYKFGGLPQDDVDYYHSAIQAVQPILALKNSSDIEDHMKAFNFLRSEFIPRLAAAWNQKIGTAFKGVKTNSERGQEGARIREMLARTSGKTTEDIAKYFISTIDYKPIKNKDSISSNTAQDMLLKGLRTNRFSTLRHVAGDVVEYYLSNYESDSEHNTEAAEILIKKLLVDQGWVKYYKKNRGDLGHSFPSDKEISVESMAANILQHIKAKKPLLFDENISEVGSSKSQSRQSTPDIGDATATVNEEEVIVSRRANYFTRSLNTAMRSLRIRADAVSPDLISAAGKSSNLQVNGKKKTTKLTPSKNSFASTTVRTSTFTQNDDDQLQILGSPVVKHVKPMRLRSKKVSPSKDTETVLPQPNNSSKVLGSVTGRFQFSSSTPKAKVTNKGIKPKR